MRIEGSRATPSDFSGLRAVDEAATIVEETKATVATTAREINMASSKDSFEERLRARAGGGTELSNMQRSERHVWGGYKVEVFGYSG